METNKTRIGLIGVGLMGHGIAANILRHGHSLALLEHPGNQPVDDLLAAGATTVGTAAALARGADVVILCVTGSPQVEDVLFRQAGLLEGLRPGGIVIDCSTAIPSSTIKIARAVEQAGGLFLDAPMTRTPKEAAAGKLNLIVGGDRAVYERCLPILQCYAENIVHAGPAGSGHQLKLLHNFVSLGFSTVLAEAAACARLAGVDAQVFSDVLSNGGGGGVVLNRLRPYIEADDPSGFRFSISNALKDMGYYQTMAEEAGAPHGAAAAIAQVYADADGAGLGQAAVPELISFLAGPANAPAPGRGES
ncbi:NAD(P)-dependent oxidoreductase [Pollutimonas bauzanensis]|uniref:3-hydroxyisobutyrate dehydrogenase n=1 Tax=Pollutimonas bauzanensis TaxID=658167 RepID=A0A1M5Y572_9BURK|nr:NAD(P)-dependent oxidoreductase [Pollutimonas bauzanensis]SHI06958.1 3-hydroxyisobutyrate dehydrogenase [Pollutimonas bauzanensis]